MRAMKTALIVIDVQNYFMNQHTEWLPARIVQHANSRPYDLIVLTKFKNKVGSNFTRILDWERCFNDLETNITPELRAIRNPEILLREGVTSTWTSELSSLVQKEGITKLYLCGVDSDACVLATAFDVFDANLDFEVIEELCANTMGEEQNNAAMRIIQKQLSYKKQIDV
jgi:nicotinamidase-related amidase